MLKIHHQVADGAYPNCTRLARELEVSAKSIQRDLAFMRDRLNLPIEYDARRYGYYYTEPVASFPTLQVSEGEIFAMLIAEKALREYRGTDFEKPLESAFRKITESLPDTISIHLAAWDSAISFRRSGRPKVDLEVFDRLSEATSHRRRLNIFYRKPGQGPAQWRVIDPYHLANVDGEWYLFAYCHLRKDVRTFNPVRIQQIEPTEATFEAPKDFDIQSRLGGSFGVIGGDTPQLIRLRFDRSVADIIREREWHTTQEIFEGDDGSLELRLTLSNLVEVHRWLMAWGDTVEVLEPASLKDLVVSSAERIIRRYH